MFKSTLSPETLKEIQTMLLNGAGFQEVMTKTGISYHNARYVRTKLVKAGLLDPYYTMSKKKRTRTTSASTRKISSAQPLTTSVISKTESVKLSVNGVLVDINNAKSVTVSSELIDIKY